MTVMEKYFQKPTHCAWHLTIFQSFPQLTYVVLRHMYLLNLGKVHVDLTCQTLLSGFNARSCVCA